jgi:hypothetical protein
MSKNQPESEENLKSKDGDESRLPMYQDFHPNIEDPQYVEKLRALYPDLPNPELMLDLGFQAIYSPCPPENLLQPSAKPSRTSRTRNLTPSEIESLREDMKKVGRQVDGRSHHLPQNKKPA